MNWYVEKVSEPGTQNGMALYPTPGFQSYIAEAGALVGTSGRGALSITSRAFMMLGPYLVEVFASRTAVARVSLAQDANLAQIAYNGPTPNQIFVASGTNGYTMNLATNATTQVLAAEATQIGMLDGYFLALNSVTGKLRLSNLNDGLTWDPLQFALRSAQPDPWVALIVNAPDIWLFGSVTSDIWYDAGTSPFPLAPRTGFTIPYGTNAPFSVAVTGGQVLWLASNKDGDGIVVRTQGYTPAAISTPELETAISTYKRTSTITDAEAFTYSQEGHTFYVLTFPSVPATWVFDLTTERWHERGQWDSTTNQFKAWYPRVHMQAFNQHLVAGRTTGTVSTMDVTYGSETDGGVIRRIRRGPILMNDMQRISVRNFEVGVECGLGLQSGQGSNPMLMGRFSGDAGKTWGNEKQAATGMVGQYRARCQFNRLGSPRLFVPEISVSDPIPWRIVNSYFNNDPQA